MSYTELAKLEVLSAVGRMDSAEELIAFKNAIALFFAQKAQKAIDAMWDNGVIDDSTIEAWGSEHMRMPYRHA